MQEQDWDPSSQPAQLIARAARLLGRRADVPLRSLNMATSHIPVLVALKEGNAMSQKELTQFAGVEQPSMAQTLARMERDGLIRKRPDPSDGRRSLIELTKTALAALPEGRRILLQTNADALAGFSESEVTTLVGFLRRMLVNLDEPAGFV